MNRKIISNIRILIADDLHKQGYDHIDIAEIMNMNVNTVKRYLR